MAQDKCILSKWSEVQLFAFLAWFAVFVFALLNNLTCALTNQRQQWRRILVETLVAYLGVFELLGFRFFVG
jgi:hypothetical protein